MFSYSFVARVCTLMDYSDTPLLAGNCSEVLMHRFYSVPSFAMSFISGLLNSIHWSHLLRASLLHTHKRSVPLQAWLGLWPYQHQSEFSRPRSAACSEGKASFTIAVGAGQAQSTESKRGKGAGEHPLTKLPQSSSLNALTGWAYQTGSWKGKVE